jgi:putative ABC transport system permease protein
MARPRRVPLAWCILTHDRRRFAWSVAGVALGVFLMFVELGFLNGAYDSTTILLDALDADLILVNRLKEDMFPMEPFPRARLAQAAAVEGVAGAYPVYVFLDARWKNERDGAEHPVRVVAFEPDDPIWRRPDLRAQAALLRKPETCLLDAASRDYYGEIRAGARGELRGRRMHVVGTFSLGPDLVVDGTLVTGLDAYRSVLRDPGGGGPGAGQVELGVIRLAPDADPRRAGDALRAALPGDVAVLGREELIRRVHAYWRRNQPVGAVFAAGMAVGFGIGVMICYQVLFTEIADQRPQYATLKAIGHRDRFLVATVFRQGIYLALLAFAAGLVASALAYAALARLTGLQMWMTPPRVALVFALTVAMCALSAAIAVRRVVRSDPAEVFG